MLMSLLLMLQVVLMLLLVLQEKGLEAVWGARLSKNFGTNVGYAQTHRAVETARLFSAKKFPFFLHRLKKTVFSVFC